MRALVVDDSAVMRRVLIGALGRANITEVDQASDGQEAVEATGSNDYGLVLMDWNMPNMTGIELLRAIRANAQLSHLPVLMITAEAKKENIVEAAQAGASGYIVKPFTAATLSEKLAKIFEKMAKT